MVIAMVVVVATMLLILMMIVMVTPGCCRYTYLDTRGRPVVVLKKISINAGRLCGMCGIEEEDTNT
jgi:hypothetical protein